jgi:hypothetical protein
MRVMLAVLIVAMCLTPLSLLLPQTASAIDNISIEVTKFGNGLENVTIDFTNVGMDSSNSLLLQTGINVNSCSMSVKALPQTPGAQTGPSDVSIDFGGDSQVEWSFSGPGVGGLGLQSVFMDDKTSRGYNIPVTGGFNNTPLIRLPKYAAVSAATMNVSFVGVGMPGKILLMYGELPTYSWWGDLQNKLRLFPEFTTIDVMDVNALTPSLNAILNYSAVLVWSDYNYSYAFKDPAALGDLLASYVDAGGAVVLGDYAMYSSGNYWLGGRFNSSGYYCIQPNATVATFVTGMLGTVSQPNHPVLAGVSNVSFPLNYTHIVATDAALGASPIAYYDNGYILAANRTVNGVKRVDLNFWPVPYSDNADWGFGGDMEKLIKNALLYSGARSASVRVDILGDGTPEYQSSNLQGTVSIPDFTTTLNQYLSTVPASFTDAYGNAFVDIPVNVSSPGLANLLLANLRIVYDYTAAIGPNPVSGNLTLAVSALVPELQGANNVRVPIFVGSSTTGRLMLDSLDVWLTPPFHSPTVRSFFPEMDTTIHENTQLDMGVNVSDMYGNPVTIKWYLDNVLLDETNNNHSIMFDYSSAGSHAVSVITDNGLKPFRVDWNITVLNVNRGPAVTESEPLSDVVNIKEGGHQNFSVEAADPDDDPLSYCWTVDGGIQIAAKTNSFTYSADFFSNGSHKVSVAVYDTGNGSASRTWTVKVENVNQPPLIKESSPKDKVAIIETQTLDFSIVTADADNQTLTPIWFLDDLQVSTGISYTYKTDYRTSGNHTVKVTVSDGALTATHEWQVTVQNLNRLPVAIIDQPLESAEFVEGQAVRLSANSSYDPDHDDQISYMWKEGNVNFSEQPVLDKPFTHGIHTIVLEVRDRNGGTSQATVHFKVRWVELSLVIAIDPTEVRAGTKMDIIVTMSNVGDTDSTDLTLELLIDGKALQSRDVSALSAGESSKQLFQWKATKGAHTITANLGELTWNKAITVEGAAAAAPANPAGDILPFVLIIIVVVGLIAWGMWALGKK